MVVRPVFAAAMVFGGVLLAIYSEVWCATKARSPTLADKHALFVHGHNFTIAGCVIACCGLYFWWLGRGRPIPEKNRVRRQNPEEGEKGGQKDRHN